MFSCEFCEISKNTVSYRTPLVTASFISVKKICSTKKLPSTFISDNFKTFEAKEIKRFALKLKINWKLILEKLPLLGGFYERLIGIIKRCLKKVAGKPFLNYDELTSLLIEIEQTLNTRPLTHLSDNNEDEAIHHLICYMDEK